ncbi:hypothetical protein E6O75_ATG07507 [Venturia nashicola]|uniref:Uncharacterized protein n=1 Tax=Venturia nashicola TaxID=86259 RepID=A0A4Z1NVA1_9PEZI|nr:hypothetical protein E6O75_ATG07507 [Venturia nashicola]
MSSPAETNLCHRNVRWREMVRGLVTADISSLADKNWRSDINMVGDYHACSHPIKVPAHPTRQPEGPDLPGSLKRKAAEEDDDVVPWCEVVSEQCEVVSEQCEVVSKQCEVVSKQREVVSKQCEMVSKRSLRVMRAKVFQHPTIEAAARLPSSNN